MNSRQFRLIHAVLTTLSISSIACLILIYILALRFRQDYLRNPWGTCGDVPCTWVLIGKFAYYSPIYVAIFNLGFASLLTFYRNNSWSGWATSLILGIVFPIIFYTAAEFWFDIPPAMGAAVFGLTVVVLFFFIRHLKSSQ